MISLAGSWFQDQPASRVSVYGHAANYKLNKGSLAVTNIDALSSIGQRGVARELRHRPDLASIAEPRNGGLVGGFLQ
jgi:hypothetical protein